MGDFIVIGVILIISLIAIWKIRRDKKKGSACCGGGCTGCPHSGSCSSNKL